MNLIELILWIFSVIVAAVAALYGFKLFGVFGLVAGIILGVVVGLVIGTSVIRLMNLVFFSKQSGRTRNKEK